MTTFGLCLNEAAAQTSRMQSQGGSNASVTGDSVKPRKPGSAWTLTTPLGEHKKSTVDTALYNYQRQWVPSMRSDVMATTGQLGGPGINMLFFDRKERTTFFFDDALGEWLPSLSTMKFYNVYVPMSLLSYNYGGSKQTHQDRLNLQFAGNVNRKVGIGAHIDYLYSKGHYESQAVKNLNFGLSGYYTGNRYEMQLLYYHLNSVNKENGGIADDLYITDPAEVQGGVEKVDTKTIPVNLTAAHNRISGNRIFMTHALKLGYWREEQVNDTLTRDVYIPVTRFVYSLDFDERHHMFKNTNVAQGRDFWRDTYYDLAGTEDHTRYWALTNTLGVELLEGFRKWAKFGINAYASLQTRRITQANYYYQHLDADDGSQTGGDNNVGIDGDDMGDTGDTGDTTDPNTPMLTPMPSGVDVLPRITQNRMWIGGTISKRQGALLLYTADARFGVMGGVAGDIRLKGDIETNFKLFGDTVTVQAYGGFANESNSYLLSHYASNHFVWDQSLGKTRTINVGGKLVIPWTKTTLSAGFKNIQNYVYFNEASLPTQHGGNVQLFTAKLDQRLKFGVWNWNNTLTYQATSNKDVIPLPAFSLYSNMFIDFKVFGVLEVQLGVDCNYFTRYQALEYQPATMSFHVQKEIEVGNYAFCDAYLTCKLSKVRFYVMCSHVNQGWFGRNCFSMPHYPVNPRTMQIGLSVDFAD